MLIRILGIILIGTIAFAGNLGSIWPDGKAEKLTYEILVSKPMTMTNDLIIEISKSSGPEAVFSINQTLIITSQSVTAKAFEKYKASNLKLISSENYFKLPAAAIAQLGTDSIVVRAIPTGDSLDITSNVAMIPNQKIALPSDLVTSVGASLLIRGIDFKVGNTFKFSELDLLSLMNQNFKVGVQEDSVIGEIAVTVPAGTFDCYKTKNMLGQAIGYGYYTKDRNHIPVMMEVVDAATGEQIAAISLKKVE